MTGTDPRTAAWQRLRERLDERAAAYRSEGYDVTVATADHGGATASDGTGRLAFTVPDDDAAALAAAAEDCSFPRTRVQYVDVAGYRLYLLAALDPGESTALLLAGGVEHQRLAALTGDDVRRAETVVRRVDGSRAVVLAHDDVGPFVEGLDDAA